jgi:hypothetical protein
VNHPLLQVPASLQNRITARVFPQWALRYPFLLRSPYAKIIAVEQFGLAPPNPWLLNSGFADAIAVESAAMLDYYREAGIPDRQLVETGSVTDDVMVAVRTDASQGRNSLLLIPTCDLYVASISPIACGKPVINYDVYRYRYSDFLKVPGVLTMEEQHEFRSALNRLGLDGEYRRKIEAAQNMQSGYWGMLDGRVGDRMLPVVERLSGIAPRSNGGKTPAPERYSCPKLPS